MVGFTPSGRACQNVQPEHRDPAQCQILCADDQLALHHARKRRSSRWCPASWWASAVLPVVRSRLATHRCAVENKRQRKNKRIYERPGTSVPGIHNYGYVPVTVLILGYTVLRYYRTGGTGIVFAIRRALHEFACDRVQRLRVKAARAND